MDEKKNFSFYDNQVIIRNTNGVSRTTFEVTQTELFKIVVTKFLEKLNEKDSELLSIFPKGLTLRKQVSSVIWVLSALTSRKIYEITPKTNEQKKILSEKYLLSLFVEELYNYWRSYERFFVQYHQKMDDSVSPKSQYMSFIETTDHLNYIVRKAYRDIAHNISDKYLRVYRQIPACLQIGIIARKENFKKPKGNEYKNIDEIPFIKLVLIDPPLILNPPANTRSGEFKRVYENPLKNLHYDPQEWLCYPARVGELLIHFYFHNKFIGLGASLANLFELVGRPDVKRKPDAIYFFGAPEKIFSKFESKTVFYEDEKNDILVGAVADLPEFGYFGYIKKLMLTLHNIIMMKRGRMPVHGAMVRISMKNKKNANLVIWGDSGAGKSETLEAFRTISEKYLRDMKIVFDDMGSLEISKDGIKGYGTEVGAFVRLDDLSLEYAFGSIDRAIIMSPQKINSRAVLPITTMEEVLFGHKVDYILYANNYEEVSENCPIFEEFKSMDAAIDIFRQGPRMAKGTTSEKGLVNSYFSNIFGPSQYKELHEKIAKRFFKKMFDSKIKVGMIRTRLGIQGYETKGPEEAAKALSEMISKE